MPRSRGFGTLIGNGWLRESPRDPLPGPKWDVRGGKSALRKCMFMPVPEQLRDLFPQVSSSAVSPPPVYRPARAEDMVPHRRDARKDAREFAAFVPAAAAAAEHPRAPATWWEDPVALGSLLILLPPVGLAAVWSSKRYSSDARWALTVMTALSMCLMTAIIIAALAMS